MAQIESGSQRGRQVNIELNLVPFIDLMSVLITFLLISAVWTQVQMIQMGASFFGKKTEDIQAQITPNMDVILRIEVKSTGYVLTIGTETFALPNLQNGSFDDAGLVAQLQRVKQLYPEKIDAILSVADDLPYEVAIKSMDQVLLTGFVNVTFAAGGPP